MKHREISALIVTVIILISGTVLSDSTGYELPDLTPKQLTAIEDYMSKGNYHAESKAYRKALNEFNKAAELAPSLFNPRYNKARMLYQLRDIEKAVGELNSINNTFKDNISGFNFLGQILVEQGKREEGKQLFEKAVKNGEAILKKSQILQVKIDIALAYHNLGSLQAEDGDLKSAEENLKKSIKADDTNYFSYYALGALMVKTGRFNDAINELQKARELNRDFMASDMALAKAYLFSKPPNAMRAISALKDAARKEPNNASIYELLGDAYIIRARTNHEIRANDYKEAMNSYRTAINLDKGNPRYKVMFARASALAGENETALKMINEIEKSEIELTDKYKKEIHLVKANIARQNEDWVNTASEYSKAYELDTRDLVIALEAGISYYEAKDYENAGKHLSIALESFPKEIPDDLKPKIDKARKMLLEIEQNK